MKTKTTILILLAAGGLLAACGGSAPEGEAAAPAAAEKQFLSLGTAPTGGTFFVIGGALAEVADQYGPEGWQVSAEATQGSRENIRRLDGGELDFALSNAAITYFAVRGEANWDRAYGVQAVMTLAPNVAFFVTRRDSGVEKIGDLRDRRVIIGPSGAGFEDFVGPILAAHGVSYDDFTLLNGPQSAAVDMLSDGSADAAFLGGGIPTASIVQASASMDLHFVPFEAAAKEQLLADYPFYAPATVPAGTYRNQDADYDGLNVGYIHLITSAAADEDRVYGITRAIYENRASVVERHASGKAIQPGNVVRDTGTTFHPGAVKFYKEIGIWPEDEADDTGGEEAAAE